jgi:hypothetical protein
MRAMAGMSGPALEEAEGRLDSLRQQLEEHLGRIEIGELTPTSGVSARGVAKKDRAKYEALLRELQKYKPGSAEHMEIRWEMYQLDHGEMPRVSWEKVYRANMDRANKANKIVAAERKRLGWPEKEHTIRMRDGDVRRLDLADPERLRGAEVKAYEGGTVWLSEEVQDEVHRDGRLTRAPYGWDMTWIFIDCEPSGPLESALLSAGISIELRTSSGADSVLRGRIPAPARRGRRNAVQGSGP